jgi:hypothetical protein
MDADSRMNRPKTLDELRAEAATDNETFAARRWFTVAQLAARWNVSNPTVREIPRDELPYKEFGQGVKLRRRRYRPADVEAFETSRLR